MATAFWRIQLLDGLIARNGEQTISRFRSYKTGALFAYLACYLNKSHSREALVDLFWSDFDNLAARGSLRTAVSSLRRQLEPSDEFVGSVLISEHSRVQLNSEACSTDLLEFEAALQRVEQSADCERDAVAFRAIDLYAGELLPGYHEVWIETERERLVHAFVGLIRPALKSLSQLKEYDRALDYALRAIAAAPLREDILRDLMRLYCALDRPQLAVQHFHELKRQLHDLGSSPAKATCSLVEQIAQLFSASSVSPALAPHLLPDSLASTSLEPISKNAVSALPSQFTRFFGRENEIERIATLLKEIQNQGYGSSRLVTLTGSGGIGKTRLSLEIASRLRDTFNGYVWFVPMAEVSSPTRMAGSIVEALGLAQSATSSPLEQALEYLNRLNAPVLFVIDNFEQIVAGGAPLLQKLLERASNVTCLVTSRRRLGLYGEKQFEITPLPIPADGSVKNLDSLKEFPSISLFVDRAQALQPDFQLTEGNQEAVSALCLKLEGLPLAIELAAARIQTLTPIKMLERFEKRFELLASRRGDKGSRHSSLWAAIDWSCHLLTPEQRKLFTQLAVFRGGWSVESVEEVCDQPAALEYLSQLRERSLITASSTESEIRWNMLDSIREYALETILDEDWEAVSQRHAERFLSLVEEADPFLDRSNQAVWFSRLDREHDNLRSALDWCASGPEGSEIGQRFGAKLWWYWMQKGYLTEGGEQLSRILGYPCGSVLAHRANILNGAGSIAFRKGDFTQSRECYDQALAIKRELGDRHGAGNVLGNLGNLLSDLGHFEEARGYLEENLAIDREFGNRPSEARSLNNLGSSLHEQGKLEEAHRYYSESLVLKRELDDSAGLVTTLNNLGHLSGQQGDFDQARNWYEEGRDIAIVLDLKRELAIGSEGLASVANSRGDVAEARRLYAAAINIWQAMGADLRMGNSFKELAEVAITDCDYFLSATIYGFSEALEERTGSLHSLHREEKLQRLQKLQTAPNLDLLNSAWNEGRSMNLQQAISAGLKLP